MVSSEQPRVKNACWFHESISHRCRGIAPFYLPLQPVTQSSISIHIRPSSTKMCTKSREAVVRVAGCVRRQTLSATRLLLGLEVVEEDGALLRLLTPVLDDNARAVDDLAGVTLAVDLACKQLVHMPSLMIDSTYRDRPTRRAACHQGP